MSKDFYIGNCKLLKTDVAKDTAEEKAFSFLNSNLSNTKISDHTSNADFIQYEEPEDVKKIK